MFGDRQHDPYRRMGVRGAGARARGGGREGYVKRERGGWEADAVKCGRLERYGRRENRVREAGDFDPPIPRHQHQKSQTMGSNHRRLFRQCLQYSSSVVGERGKSSLTFWRYEAREVVFVICICGRRNTDLSVILPCLILKDHVIKSAAGHYALKRLINQDKDRLLYENKGKNKLSEFAI